MKSYIYRYSIYPHRFDKRDFYYLNSGKKRVKPDKSTLQYIQDLKIPPGYHPVKINLNKNAKILAIGIDKKGKSQYIYHPNWVKNREKSKQSDMITFGKKIPKIKATIKKNISQKEMSMDKLISIILQLIITCHFRVGNEIGKDLYDSYGLTTISKKQVKPTNKYVEIDFIGKSGVVNICKVVDSQLIDVLKNIHRERNNKETFFTYKPRGKKFGRKITSKDVNKFLKQFGDFSSKNFRTWMANVEFIDELLDNYNPKTKYSQNERKKLFRDALQATAEKLHHTPSICKKAYINQDLQNIFLDKPDKFNKLVYQIYHNKNNSNTSGYTRSEKAFMSFLHG